MVIWLDPQHQLERNTVKQEETCRYLEAIVTKDCKYGREVLKRIGMAKTRFNEMRKVLTNMNVSTRLRLRLLKCCIWSVFVYSCKAWSLDQKLRRRIVAVEMWLLRRMQIARWTEIFTNEIVLEMAGDSRELLGAVRKGSWSSCDTC